MTTSAENGRKGGQLAMHKPPVVPPQAWEVARKQLLVKEKAQTRARDALAAERRRMPWMAVETAYAFDGPAGKASLLDLFDGRRQLSGTGMTATSQTRHRTRSGSRCRTPERRRSGTSTRARSHEAGLFGRTQPQATRGTPARSGWPTGWPSRPRLVPLRKRVRQLDDHIERAPSGAGLSSTRRGRTQKRVVL
jgi:hypothetical protein